MLSIMKLNLGKALAKFVPAAAVKRIERVLFIGTRRKELLGCNINIFSKRLGLNPWITSNNLLLDYSRGA